MQTSSPMANQTCLPRFASFAIGIGVLWAGTTGCVTPAVPDIRLNDDVVLPDKCVVIISPDGVDHVRFHKMLAAGQLPNIQRLFVDGGVDVRRAFDSLPSVTYANYSSLITGRFPGHHDITGNLWLDRQTLQTRYYMTLSTYRTVNEHLNVPTMYEMLADHFTFNIQCHTRRGVTYTLDNSELFKWAWILGRYTAADNHVPDTMAKVARVANRVKRWPSVITTYYPGVDEIGHRYGPGSAEYGAALENIDVVVGKFIAMLGQLGVTDRTYFVLATDHGMPPVEPDKHFDFKRWLRDERKLHYLNGPLRSRKYPERFEELSKYDAFLVIGADRRAAIHLPGRRGWNDTPSPAEVESFIQADPPLSELPAVDCALMRAGQDRIKVLSSRGTAFVERRHEGSAKQYRLMTDEQDPTGYLADATLADFVRAGWHTSREWLAATANADRPDFVPQALEMFDSPRTGDVVAFAATGWDFSPGQKGAHGSCLSRDMDIALYFAGPDLPQGASIDCARFVDVAPTVLGLLGEADRLEEFPAIDGINLADQLREAK